MAINPYRSPESDKPIARRAKWYRPKRSPYHYVMWFGFLAVGAAILAFHLLTQYRVYQMHLDR